MKPITVIDPALPVIFKVAPNLQVVSELRQRIEREEAHPLAELVEYEYAWYAHQNKWLALELTEGLRLAWQMQLPVQTKLYAEQVFSCVTKDLAEHVYNLAVHQLGYRGEITYRPYNAVPGQTFRELIKTEANRRHEWVFDPIERFTKLIPPHALKAMQMLADEAIQPDAYWVADKVETVLERPRSLDPIVCAQFGHWLAGLAFWL